MPVCGRTIRRGVSRRQQRATTQHEIHNVGIRHQMSSTAATSTNLKPQFGHTLRRVISKLTPLGYLGYHRRSVEVKTFVLRKNKIVGKVEVKYEKKVLFITTTALLTIDFTIPIRNFAGTKINLDYNSGIGIGDSLVNFVLNGIENGIEFLFDVADNILDALHITP